MAERRMFSKTIIDSDAFLDMPVTAQLLYFHLAMRADDDGFINKPKSIMRMCGCKDDDIKLLISKGFVIPFQAGIVVIRHWRVHNYIRKDTYTETKYQLEKSTLELSESLEYVQVRDECVTGSSQVRDECVEGTATQVRLGKDRLGKDRLNIYRGKNTKRFTPPTPEEVKKYCEERGNNVDAGRFVDFYTAKNWLIGKNKMKDWKAAVRTWERSEKNKTDGCGNEKDAQPKKEMTIDEWFGA